jgi:rubredoxin
MDKYVCPECGYVYDPEVGDPEHGIAPGTAFEDLPADWHCPYCGVDKQSLQSFESVMGTV